MSVVVTGAAGVVGRACLALLREGGVPARGLSRSGADGLTPCDYGPADLDRVLAGADAVIHLAAARPGPGARGTDNAALTAAVAQAAQRAGTHLVLASSVAVHGPPTGAVLREDSPLRPEGDYARSKVGSEEAARAVGGSVVRLSHVYGAAEDNAYFVNIAISRALRGEPIHLTGTSPGRRNLLHADDAALALLAAARHRGPGPWLAAGPAAYLNSELADTAARVLAPPGAKVPVHVDAAPDFVEGGVDEAMDGSATLSALGLPAPADLETGLRRIAAAPGKEHTR